MLATLLLAAGAASGYGVASALLPVVNAEAYAVVGALRSGPIVLVAVVLGLAAGQTAGKLVMFEVARRTRRAARVPAWLARRRAKERSAVSRERLERLEAGLRRPRTGVPLVACSAAVGLPPLAAVSLVAGAAGQSRSAFGLTCLVGRVARFAVVVVPVTLAG